MDEELNNLFAKNTLEEYCHKHYDENEKNFQYYRQLPIFTQIRIYFEYWFLHNIILSKKITLAATAQECYNIGWRVNDDQMIRLITSITTNGCISITTPTMSRVITNINTILLTDFIYFNNANPTYKVGKIPTDEIFKWMNNKNDHNDIAKKVVATSMCLNEILKKILKNNQNV